VQREEASGFSPYVVHYRLSIPALSDIKELKKNSRRRTLARTASDKRLAAHQQHINQQLFLVHCAPQSLDETALLVYRRG
jgi:hypothetical protein